LKFAWGLEAETVSGPSFLSLSCNNVDNYRGADERGDSVKGDDAALAWQIADKVTNQGNN
jgi:hypothetical protein